MRRYLGTVATSALGQKATLSEPIKRVCYRGLSGRAGLPLRTSAYSQKQSCGSMVGKLQLEEGSSPFIILDVAEFGCLAALM